MIAVDTNILVYAHRGEYPQQEAAQQTLRELVNQSWAIPWPCVHEFLSVVTRKNYLLPPTPLDQALAQITSLLATTTLRLLHETDQHWAVFDRLVKQSQATGHLIHDAKIAAICLQHGVKELWSADRDFSRLTGLKTVNPLV